MAKYFELILPDRAWVYPTAITDLIPKDRRHQGGFPLFAISFNFKESTSSSGTLKQFKAKQKH